MIDFNNALEDFINSVNEDGAAYWVKHYSNLEYKDAVVAGGRKYVKIVRDRSVYCFVATQDVPAKNVKRGDVLKAAGWNTPALKRKNPAAANIFDPESYKNVNKAYTTWLYA